MNTFRIESLLAARLFLEPRLADDRLYFISDLSGRLSLYVMDVGGSVPEPLLPPDIALQNPHHLSGEPFVVLPTLAKILVLIDQNGDENYQPMVRPIAGGLPEPLFDNRLAGCQVTCAHIDAARNLACPLLAIQGANDPRVVEQESGRPCGTTAQGRPGRDLSHV